MPCVIDTEHVLNETLYNHEECDGLLQWTKEDLHGLTTMTRPSFVITDIEAAPTQS